MVFSSLGRLVDVLRALNRTCLSCLLTGRHHRCGAFDMQDMTDEQKRDIGLLDGRATYRRR